jgi:undecaprenyl-diphosphatase
VISYFQAIVIGVLQGVTELFPISSLGHSILLPAWIGWDDLVTAQHQSGESFYLAFVVALHVATACALLVYFHKDWVGIIGGFFRTLRTRRVETADERMAWLLVVGTLPVVVVALVLEGPLEELFAKPLAAAIFLTVNGGILAGGEWLRRRAHLRADKQLDSLRTADGALVGASQVAALFAGISRSGVTMVAGLFRGLDHEDSARFSFLLATPIILGAGVYKLPVLLGPVGDGVRGQALVGSLFAGVAAFFSVHFLVRFFRTQNLLPFAVYCVVVGAASIVRFA